ncbi:uncharacterized protein F5147DRAFT_784639 [Suillus discolor]|uniref:Uncharacterized protein n=1 Tax=Suillus discolor TaxID=1912936 RepID=A0A9P7JL07_9AGAM|nr:uncharacterized protein F5147DRAFT_784639 [Suillus discolor]KAG2079942.1 hypothetical protein F5147DRAFT_784639 [Suillus discolor]
MPSSEVSNKAFNEVTAGMLQILARALQLTKGPAGYLNMATEMANIMTPAFQSHAQLATEIPPILLSVAMELMEHVDCAGQTSFLGVPVWNNIKSNDSRIEHHQLYGKAHKVMTASAPAPMSQPPDTPPVEATTNTPAVPSVVAKSKPPGRSVTRKTPIDLCADSDEVKIVGDITQSNAVYKRKQRSVGASEEVAVCHEDKVIAPAIVDKAEDVAPGNTNTTPTRPRPKLKSKQVEIVVLSGFEVPMDRKGKGREVTLPLETHRRDREWKKSRDVSSGGPPKKGSHHPPPMQNIGDQWKPWYGGSGRELCHSSLCLSHYCILRKRVSTRTATCDQQKSEAMLAEQKAMVAPEPVGTMSMAMQADVNAVSSQNALSLPPHLVKNTPITTIPLTLPPRPTQSPPSFAADIKIDVFSDTVARDFQAMTLEVKLDSVLPLVVVQNTINDLQTQVADIRTRNTKMAELVQIMNAHLAAQDTDIRAMEKMCAEIAILQEEVKALHAKSQTHEGQIRSTDSMLTAQGHRTAVLMDAYESIRQCVVPNPPIPHFNNAVFFPPPGRRR